MGIAALVIPRRDIETIGQRRRGRRHRLRGVHRDRAGPGGDRNRRGVDGLREPGSGDGRSDMRRRGTAGHGEGGGSRRGSRACGVGRGEGGKGKPGSRRAARGRHPQGAGGRDVEIASRVVAGAAEANGFAGRGGVGAVIGPKSIPSRRARNDVAGAGVGRRCR